MEQKTKDELSRKLDPKHVFTRQKGKTTLFYITAWHAIDEANNIFGFDKWKRETVYNKEVCRYDYTVGKGDYASQGHKVGYEAKVLITVGDIVREGTGHGSGIAKDLFDAIESAAKEAESDAMKRALMTFGNRFGLALYDKTQANVGIDKPVETPEQIKTRLITAINKFTDSAKLSDFERNQAVKDARDKLHLTDPKLSDEIYTAITQKQASFLQSPSGLS